MNKREKVVAAVATVVLLAGAILSRPGIAEARFRDINDCDDFKICDWTCEDMGQDENAVRHTCADRAEWWFNDCQSTYLSWNIGDCEMETIECIGGPGGGEPTLLPVIECRYGVTEEL